jgi:AmmeMemoRadiSam system protein A
MLGVESGFAAGALHAPPPPELDVEDREQLLGVARTALAVATGQRPVAALADTRSVARGLHVGEVCAAVFVTLTEREELRGCIGTPVASLPLPDGVARAALSAALDDPRFMPVAADELPAIHVDISVLGRLAELPRGALPRAGLEGVVVELDGHRGLLLPEVAVAQDWDAAQLLAGASRKAGLPGNAWRDSRAHVLAFRTVRFGGPACMAADAQALSAAEPTRPPRVSSISAPRP